MGAGVHEAAPQDKIQEFVLTQKRLYIVPKSQ